MKRGLGHLETWPVLHIPITFPSVNYCSVCIVIAKIFFDLAGVTMALIFMAGCSSWLCQAKNKQRSLCSDQTRPDKPLSKHSRENRFWSTRVIYRGCRDVDSNSWLRLYHTWDINVMVLTLAESGARTGITLATSSTVFTKASAMLSGCKVLPTSAMTLMIFVSCWGNKKTGVIIARLLCILTLYVLNFSEGT